MKRYAVMSERKDRLNFCIKTDDLYYRVEVEIPIEGSTYKVYVNGELDMEYHKQALVGGVIVYAAESRKNKEIVDG